MFETSISEFFYRAKLPYPLCVDCSYLKSMMLINSGSLVLDYNFIILLYIWFCFGMLTMNQVRIR